MIDYVKRRVIKDYGIDDLSRAAEIYYQDLMSRLVPYDRSRYRDYPEILKRYIEKHYGRS